MGSDMKRIPLRAAGGGGARVPQTQARQGGGSPRGRGFNRALPVRVPPCPPVSPVSPPSLRAARSRRRCRALPACPARRRAL